MKDRDYRNPKSLLAEGEENAVRTRLAAGEVHSQAGRNMINSAAGLEAAVKQRIMAKTGYDTAEVQSVYTRMITMLQQADLTVNFQPKTLFENMPSAIENVHQRDTGAPGYVAHRHLVENGLFKYNAAGTNFHIEEVINRISSRGDEDYGNNASFDPAIRPRYGALNIFNLKYGAAGGERYGHSYLVLKDYIKQRCTFTRTDSFVLIGEGMSEELANLFYLDKIILGLNASTFSVLCSRITNQPLGPDDQIDFRYIEAQIHSEILFSRDVKKIYLRRSELGLEAEGSKIIENIALVACKSRIEVAVID